MFIKPGPVLFPSNLKNQSFVIAKRNRREGGSVSKSPVLLGLFASMRDKSRKDRSLAIAMFP